MLDELGTLLGVLRQSGDDPGTPSEPTPGLSLLGLRSTRRHNDVTRIRFDAPERPAAFASVDSVEERTLEVSDDPKRDPVEVYVLEPDPAAAGVTAVAHAFAMTHQLEKAMQAQLDALATGRELIIVSEETAERAADGDMGDEVLAAQSLELVSSERLYKMVTTEAASCAR